VDQIKDAMMAPNDEAVAKDIADIHEELLVLISDQENSIAA